MPHSVSVAVVVVVVLKGKGVDPVLAVALLT